MYGLIRKNRYLVFKISYITSQLSSGVTGGVGDVGGGGGVVGFAGGGGGLTEEQRRLVEQKRQAALNRLTFYNQKKW